MKYSKRMMKYKNEYRPPIKKDATSGNINWKKIFMGLVAIDVIASSILAAFMISKKNETPVEKYSKNLNKKYKKSKKKLSKKANRLIKEIESTADELQDKINHKSDNALSKGKDIKTLTLEKSKKTLSELNDLLDDISKKIKEK